MDIIVTADAAANAKSLTPAKKSSGETSPLEDAISPSSKQLAEDAEREGCPEVRQKLIDSKLARKQAEEDRKKLANRIQKLKFEEEKVFFLRRLYF